MSHIQLCYVENRISRLNKKVQQTLDFLVCVENLSFDKEIDVFWAGEDGEWQTLTASFYSGLEQGKEYWRATIKFSLTQSSSLPGNIQFSIRYRVPFVDYWDNNNGLNYTSEADSGIQLGHKIRVQNIGFPAVLTEHQQETHVRVAVETSIQPHKVTLHWTTDEWKTSEQTECHTAIDHWNSAYKSNARNPNQYGIQIWEGIISHGTSFSLQYSISCEDIHGNILWDNNFGNNYCLKHEQLKVLILNLHCYQEDEQQAKFTQIAHAIDELEADIVCLQEVAEYWNDGHGDWHSNSARIINDQLKHPYHMQTDWAHIGFDIYKEGVAILSRYPLSNHESRYVSESHEIYNIHSRKVVFAKVHVPYMGAVNVFSAHLSWIEDGFKNQFQRLHDWAEQRNTEDVKATLLCGDFNITAGTEGYQFVVESNHYDDQYLQANHHGVFERIFRVNDAHWHDLLTDDYRIDYIFMDKKSQLKVTSAQVVFTEEDYGRVSDHCGFFMTFEPKVYLGDSEEG